MSWRLAIEDSGPPSHEGRPYMLLDNAVPRPLAGAHPPTSAGASGGWRGALKPPDAGRWITAGYTDVAACADDLAGFYRERGFTVRRRQRRARCCPSPASKWPRKGWESPLGVR
ncbi:MAG: hypothetical protein OXF26_07745 [Alphaproteobacteria bacterium]|nr:hypothetical protein [Alphaproteobacteria bacterium]MCY4320453.1 hypothetical protein [Alphaproteobacteria bacterium]